MLREKLKKSKNQAQRKKRTRSQIAAHSNLPRLSVFRSLKHFYTQIIDDSSGKTVCAATDSEVKDSKNMKPTAIAKEVGKLIAIKALEKKVETVVFDRGNYQYHGRVAAAAEGAREGGLKF
jgi:large subunit ribosomal protein L18